MMEIGYMQAEIAFFNFTARPLQLANPQTTGQRDHYRQMRCSRRNTRISGRRAPGGRGQTGAAARSSPSRRTRPLTTRLRRGTNPHRTRQPASPGGHRDGTAHSEEPLT